MRAGRGFFFKNIRACLLTAAGLSVKLYQRWVSPNIAPSCRYHPSCSNYFYDAVKKYGLFYGGLKGFYRVIRCNPFSRGGFDPVDK